MQATKKPRMRGLKASPRKKKERLNRVYTAEVRNLLKSSSLGNSELHNLVSNTKRPVRRCRSNSKSNQPTTSDFEEENSQSKCDVDLSSPVVNVVTVPERKRRVKGPKVPQPRATDEEEQFGPAADQDASQEVVKPRKSSRRRHSSQVDESQRSPIADLDMIDQKLEEVSRSNTPKQADDHCGGTISSILPFYPFCV